MVVKLFSLTIYTFIFFLPCISAISYEILDNDLPFMDDALNH